MIENLMIKERLKTVHQSSLKVTFFASFRLTDPPDSVKKCHQLLRCFKKLIYLKEVLESCTIILLKMKQIQGFIAQFMRTIKKGKKFKVLEATRPYVRCKDPEEPDDRVGEPAYCKP